MIEFPCRCKYSFQVPADQAGLSIQCPKCGLLMSVPNFGDAGHIEPDGTYTLEAAAEPFPEGLLKDLSLVYYPKRQLTDGTEIDLRGPVEGIAAADEAAKDHDRDRMQNFLAWLIAREDQRDQRECRYQCGHQYRRKAFQ